MTRVEQNGGEREYTWSQVKEKFLRGKSMSERIADDPELQEISELIDLSSIGADNES